MKFFTQTLVLAFFLSLAAASHAQQHACGGNIEYSADCGNNSRSWHFACCPDGYRVHGIAYSDLPGQDSVDAITTVCRNIQSGNTMSNLSERTKRSLNQIKCDKTEVVSGLVMQDVRKGNSNKDWLDAVSVECLNPRTSYKRTLYNPDFGGRGQGRVSYDINTEVVGFAYKELDDGSSDKVDCVTTITKPRRHRK